MEVVVYAGSTVYSVKLEMTFILLLLIYPKMIRVTFIRTFIGQFTGILKQDCVHVFYLIKY